ncbi:DUF6462 family protein [Bariatricus sp. SGI.161]|uniref:DUF6462 family protein n=1 Tax=Bariatricus sp. SGI.161 TaxID=3420550 RepID=UPI003D03D58E
MDKQNIKLTEKRLLNMTEFQAYTSVGRNSAMKLAHESGTEVRIGRRVLVDRVKFDEWCDQYL